MFRSGLKMVMAIMLVTLIGVIVVGGCKKKEHPEHPDTGSPIAGLRIPHWSKIVSMSARCYEAVELGYLGVDIVLDRELGPLILELNARPGLNIQIANRRGLCSRFKAVDGLESRHVSPEQRVEWSCKTFGDPVTDLLNQAPW